MKATAAPAPPPPPLSEYILTDLASRPRGTAVPLDKPSRAGVLLNGARFILEDGRARAAGGSSRASLTAVDRIPQWLGGGFLFRSGSSLYSSDTFDGPLNPIVKVPDSISRVSFGPRGVLVRGSEGNRWLFEVPSLGASRPHDPWGTRPSSARPNGFRMPIAPVGLVDIGAVNDGRALAITEAGSALMSTRRGETWDDITPKLRSVPAEVVVREDELFLTVDGGGAYKLERGGALIELDHLPPAPKSPQAVRDPRWHASMTPRELALSAGARLDNGTAVVAAAGDVAVIDIRSGEIKTITQGRLPPNLTCEALRVPDDVVIVCSGAGGPSLVASGVLSEEGLRIERTFPLERPFYASEEGALVFGGPCSSEGLSPWVGCARDLGGRWHEHTVESAALAGEKDAVTRGSIEDVRWVPRADKPPIAILVRTEITVIDPTSGEPTPWQVESIPGEIEGMLAAVRPAKPRVGNRFGGPILDRRWTALASGSLRGWVTAGRSVDVSPKGFFAFSPFKFDRAVVSGATALSLTGDGRLWQTRDHGAIWVEVAAPPSAGFEMKSCSPVGCSLGLWHRIGWEASAPDPKAQAEPVSAPPPLSSPPLPEITCSAAGEAREAALPPTTASPGDVGIGATKTPFSTVLPSGQPLTYRRATYSRTLNNPPRSSRVADETVPFVMVHNFAVDIGEIESANGVTNTLVVLGPSTNVASFRQTITFLAPFDPTAAIRSPALGLGAFTAAARGAGATVEEALTTESESEGFVPVLPLEPGAPSDLVYTSHLASGDIMGVITAGPRASVRLVGLRRIADTPISAVALPGGDIAILAASPSTGGSRVLRLHSTFATELGGIPGAPPSDLQPPNPDALAIGPQGTLAILRTPSGDEPASADDPALLIELSPGASSAVGVPASKITPLAPWSTLTSAADPACRSDASGYRAILQTRVPWLRLRGARRDVSLYSTMMLAQVRWSPARVCLEALELPEGNANLPEGAEMETLIIARFAPPLGAAPKGGKTTPATGSSDLRGGSASRVGVALGFELRQPLSCSLVSP